MVNYHKRVRSSISLERNRSMSDALYARRADVDHHRTPTKVTSSSQQHVHRAIDPTHLPLYTRLWSNQPPSRLHLPAAQPAMEPLVPTLRSTQRQEDNDLTTQDGETILPVEKQAVQNSFASVEVDQLGPRIQAARSGGQPLGALAQSSLEQGLGADLSSVRVHTDAEADHLAHSINAVAFTSGADIFFRSEMYNPDSSQGLHLLAHEATHVVQQAKGQVTGTPRAGGISISDPEDHFEQAAEVSAARLTRGSTLQHEAVASSDRPDQLPQAQVFRSQSRTAPGMNAAVDEGEKQASKASSAHPQRGEERISRGGSLEIIQRTRSIPGTGKDAYEVDDFTYNEEMRERPTKATVSLRQQNQKPSPPAPMSFIGPDKKVDGDKGWHRGHVAAYSFGGANESYNIVPLKPGFNRGSAWRQFEAGIDKFVEESAKEEEDSEYQVTIAVSYEGSLDPRIPARFKVKRPSEMLSSGSTKKVKIDLPDEYEHKGEITPQPETLLGKGLLVGSTSIEELQSAIARLENEGAKVQHKIDGHLPALVKPWWPDEPKNRPYEELDIKYLAAPNTSFTISPGQDFSDEQRRILINANRSKNGGKLKSDDPKDLYQDLDEDGLLNFPEVDHIIPKSSLGSNAFSNARVVSLDLNNRGARVKSLAGLVDVTRLSYPAIKKLGDKVDQILLRAPKGGMTIKEIINKLVTIYAEKNNKSLENKVKNILEGLVREGAVDYITDSDKYKPAL